MEEDDVSGPPSRQASYVCGNRFKYLIPAPTLMLVRWDANNDTMKFSQRNVLEYVWLWH